nr:DUF3160 domain-containing protein [Bacteroidales bacterium]
MKRILISSLAIALLASCGGGNNANNQGNGNTVDSTQSAAKPEEAPAPELPPLKMSDQEFFNGKNKLPQQVDVTEPVESMSYQRLRFMKAYVYATKGFWLRDFDLNTFFTKRSNWYVDACYKRAEKITDPEKYWGVWENNYDQAMSNEKISDEEKAFVNSIDKRLAEIATQYYTDVNGAKIANPLHCTNAYQFPVMYDRNSTLWQTLAKHNIAFQTTNYDQLFNIYEDNEYHCVPNFVTTDLFLQAFHMYFEYALKLSENGAFTEKLITLCKDMTANNLYADATSDKEKDLAEFTQALFAIVYQLLDPSAKPSVSSNYSQIVNDEIDLINKAQDTPSPMLKTGVNFAYSLFKPRGHYSRNEKAQRYFRAMMWLQTASMQKDKPEDIAKAITMAYYYNKIQCRDDFEKMYN